jgi:hypothetical protein
MIKMFIVRRIIKVIKMKSKFKVNGRRMALVMIK